MQTFANGVAVHWGGEGLLVGVGPLFWGDRNASEALTPSGTVWGH